MTWGRLDSTVGHQEIPACSINIETLNKLSDYRGFCQGPYLFARPPQGRPKQVAQSKNKGTLRVPEFLGMSCPWVRFQGDE